MVNRMSRAATVLAAIATAHFWSADAGAQTREDTQLWVGAGATAALGKTVRLGVEQELRVGSQAGFDETFTDVGLGLRFDRFLRAGAHYRYIVQDGETRHRVAGDVTASFRKKPIELSWRVRLQATTRENDDALVPIRNRFGVAVDLPHRLEPYAALEVHYMLSPVNEYRERRLYLGVSWGVTKDIDLRAYYLNLREANVAEPDAFHVLGLSLSVQVFDARDGKRRSGDEAPPDPPDGAEAPPVPTEAGS